MTAPVRLAILTGTRGASGGRGTAVGRCNVWRVCVASVATLVVSLAVSLAAVPATASAVTSAASAEAFWAPLQVGGHLTATVAAAAAKRYRIFVAPASELAPFVTQMKAANPQVVLLAYVNGTNQGSATAFPPSLYLKDAHGRRVETRDFQSFLMDFTNPLWIQNRAQMCVAAIASAHLDGCHLDVLGTSSLSPGYTTGLPIDPHTNQVFTPAEWLLGTDGLAAQVQSAAGKTKIIIGNGLTDGAHFYNIGPSSILLGGEAGGVAEAWLRNAVSPLDQFPSVTDWKLNVDMLGPGSQGKIIVTITKAWGTGTPALLDQWHQFSLASFLLGDSGRDAYSFFPSRGASALANDPWDGFPIGSPTGSYLPNGNGFERDFTTGKVLVNPSTSTWTVNLGGTYRDVSGHHMTTATLLPDSGLILAKG